MEERISGMVGRRIGVYDIVAEVGKGGMGVVYRAHDRSLDRDVAIKVLLPSLSADAEFEKRFVREARAAARLDHPNIVQVHTAGRAENLLFIAMQFVQGKTLSDVQGERNGRFEWQEALRIVRQAADALDAAHKVGLVHRDIKPTNIMIDESQRVKIMDFGLMRSSLNPDRITQTGVFFGTPEYASPEQCNTTHVDGRSDIYSLGAVLYEMLTGRVPHVAETPLALFRKISEEDAQGVGDLNPQVPKPVVALVRKMLARLPDDRYASCGELIADIDRALGGQPVTAKAVASPSGRRTALAVMSSVAALLIAGLVWLLAPGRETVIEPPASGKMGVVVFDFRNGTGGSEQQWYEVALSDMLITYLAQNDALSVPTRDQLLWKIQDMALGDRVRDEHRRKLVSEFGAHAYVAGTYYAQGGRVRVTATCYRIRDNTPAFPPMQFDRPESEVFALIDDVGRAVADGLRGATGRVMASTAAPSRGASPVKGCREAMLARVDAVHEQEKARSSRSLAETRGEAKQQLQDAGRKKDKAPGAPSPAGDAKEQLMEKLGKLKDATEIVIDADGMRHWYQTRQSLEKAGCDADEFRILAVGLEQQLSNDDIAARQRCLDSLQQSFRALAVLKKTQGCKVRPEDVTFVCLGCAGGARSQPGACEKCGAVLALQLQVQTAAGKKP